jgi:acyl-CoA thioesterase-1
MPIAEHAADARPRPRRAGRKPVELIVMGALRFARAQNNPDIRHGNFRQWCNGVAKVCSDRAPFAEYWNQRNEWALTDTGPLWVVLGDSTAQGLGADHPQEGYVSQTQAQFIHRSGRPWRVLNLSSSGATIPDVVRDQVPRLTALAETPDLVTCGVGTNDLLRVPPPKVRGLFDELIDAVPEDAVLLDVPIPEGRCRVGRFAAQYVNKVNTSLYAAAGARRLRIAYVSRHFTPPWTDKFGPDDFHPNAAGYDYWSRALLQAVPGRR